MINDAKYRLRQTTEKRYSVLERLLFIGGGVVFCFAFTCGLLGVGL